jgi:hypothetical protein
LRDILTVLFLVLLAAACVPYMTLPRLAKEQATVIVRCSEKKGDTQMIVVLLDHTRNLDSEAVNQKRRLQRIAEIEIDSDCHFTVRAPKTPIELHQP